ncbi:ComEC/Rec2 family competence protein, partial [Planktotalea sp.]|uniref:ComEC/Rec2 family competence protein n=1 Tax=Planktotalea sp. TaxID=2029877 RepID=UPI003296E765
MKRKEHWRDALNAEMGQGFVWTPVIFALGILLFFSVPSEPSTLHYCATTGLCIVGIIAFRHTSYELRPLFWCITLVAAGFSMAAWRTTWIAEPVLDWRYYGPVEGRVIGLDRSGSGAMRVTLDQVALGNRSAQQTPAQVRISLFGSDAEQRPAAGARVMTTAHLSPPSGPAEPHGFDFQRHAWFEQLGALGYTRVPLLLASLDQDVDRFFAARLALSDRIRKHLEGQTGAFAAALMTGDRSELSQKTLTDLRHSNLAHLLAISGLHMGLLV